MAGRVGRGTRALMRGLAFVSCVALAVWVGVAPAQATFQRSTRALGPIRSGGNLLAANRYRSQAPSSPLFGTQFTPTLGLSTLSGVAAVPGSATLWAVGNVYSTERGGND